MMTTENVNLFYDTSKISAYTSAVFLLRFQQFCEGNFCNLISFYVRGEQKKSSFFKLQDFAKKNNDLCIKIMFYSIEN